MNTLNKICTALVIIFVVSLFVIVVEFLYVLYRRRRSQNRRISSTGVVECSSVTSSFSHTVSSKELMYFFCWKNQATRVEPDHVETAATSAADTSSLQHTIPFADDVADVDEMLKRHTFYGASSRVLFTIREEEKEDIEMDLSSVERERSISLEEVSSIAAATVIDVDDTTPFSTPCSSPDFYTPSPSPSRERNLKPDDVESNR